MSKFYGAQTPYDEEQSRQRYMEYLRIAGRNSSLKQNGERDVRQGIAPTTTDKTTSEILADEAEMSRVLQQRIAQLVQRADGRPRTPNETDDMYEQRTNPISYVLTRLGQPQSKLLITSFEAIKADLAGSAGNMLPADFLTYLDAYERAYQQSGGVSKFNVSTRIIDEIEGLKANLADKTDISNISTVLVEMSRALDKQRDLSVQERKSLKRDLNTINDRLEAMNAVVQDLDFDRLENAVELGVENIMTTLKGRMALQNESIFKQLMDKLETLPTSEDLAALETTMDAMLTSQVLDYEQADKVIESALELTSTITVGKINDIIKLLNVIDEKANVISLASGKIAGAKDLTSARALVSKEMFGQTYAKLSKEEKTLVDERARQLVSAEAQVVPGTPVLARPLGQRTIEESMASAIAPLEYVEETEPFDIEPKGKGKSGNGIKSQAYMAKNRIQPKFSTIVGRGISVPVNSTKYKEFGKYAISEPHLSKGIFSVRYLKNGNMVQSLPARKITEEFADFMDEFLETTHLDKKRLDKLQADEKRFFAKLINGSGLYGKYKVRLMKSKEEEAEEDRFNLVKGIYIAGNDNNSIVKELKQFIIKFMADGRIPKKEGTDLLLQLSI